MSRTYRNNWVGEKSHHNNAKPYVRVSKKTDWLKREEENSYQRKSK